MTRFHAPWFSAQDLLLEERPRQAALQAHSGGERNGQAAAYDHAGKVTEPTRLSEAFTVIPASQRR